MKNKSIKIILSALLLLCLLQMPYGYYQFVRFIAMIGFAYLAFSVNRKNNKNEFFIYIALALLFQPFIKIALGRTLWNIVDVVVGVGLLVSMRIKKINFRMSYFNKKNALIFFAVFTFLLLLAYPYRYKIKRRIIRVLHHDSREVRGSVSCPSCHIHFTDNIATHEQAYKEEGIMPQIDFKGLNQLLESGKLVKLHSNKFYIIRDANFSKPYILPKGYNFIERLSNKYSEQCKLEKIKYIPFTISSVTRSIKSVKHLSANNRNAIKNSAHLKGKTFDISWRAFNNNGKQLKVFINVLVEFTKKNKCFVKFENNGCLHITVI